MLTIKRSGLKTQLFSLIPITYSVRAIQNVFEASNNQIKTSRKHALKKIGMIVEKKDIFSDRIDNVSLLQFIEFITSQEYLHDVAYGDPILKNQISGTICLQDSIRLAPHIKIVEDYLKVFRGLPTSEKSSCFKNFEKIFRLRLKNHFKDNVMSDGLDAFD